MNSFINKRIELFFKQTNKKKRERERERVCVTFIFDPLAKSLNSKSGMLHHRLHWSCFYLISFSPHFIARVSSYLLQFTLHWSCFIFISFSPQSISLISSTTVHLVHIYFIWLYSCYMVIQRHCQFHFSGNAVSGN